MAAGIYARVNISPDEETALKIQEDRCREASGLAG